MKKPKVQTRQRFPNEGDGIYYVLPPIRVSKAVRKSLEIEAENEGLCISAYARQLIHKGRIAVGAIKKTDARV